MSLAICFSLTSNPNRCRPSTKSAVVINPWFTCSTIAMIRRPIAAPWYFWRMTFLEILRLRRGLSKAEAARLVRMLSVDYSLAERGLLTPSAAQAERLETVFGYPIAQLLTSIEGPPAAARP